MGGKKEKLNKRSFINIFPPVVTFFFEPKHFRNSLIVAVHVLKINTIVEKLVNICIRNSLYLPKISAKCQSDIQKNTLKHLNGENISVCDPVCISGNLGMVPRRMMVFMCF